jgi:hypothetical protein
VKKKQQGKRPDTASHKKDSDSLSDMLAPMRELVEQNRKLFVERHEYRDATPADLEGGDRKWYDAAERELAGLGYRRLREVVNETVARAAGVVVVMRWFAAENRENVAAIYQFLHGKSDLRVCEIEAEFSDGSFLHTSNAEASARVSVPPQIHTTKYPAGTPIGELVARHDAAKRKLLATKRKKLRIVEVTTAAECEAMQHRQEAIRAAFRQGIGYLDPAEVRRIAEQKSPDEPLSAGVLAATADIARSQAQAERADPRAAGLFSMLLAGGGGGTGKGKPKADFGMASTFRELDVPADKRGEITATMSNLLASADSGDAKTGMQNLFSLMGQLRSLETPEQEEAKRRNVEQSLAKMKKEADRHRAAHVTKRRARGLSEKAGTGKPEPEILIHGLPVGDLDYKDKRGRSLDAMVKEINASKARRNAKILGKLPLGHSRIGGLPDLPPDHPWPTHKGRKIPFVAQLNLADFPRDARPLLPERGHLYAFALISNDEPHWPPPVSVFLYEGDAKSLVRAKVPSDDQIWPDWGGVRVYEVLPATAKPKGRDPKKRSREFGETLGWLQGSMDEVFGKPGELADDRLQDGDDWINLLAIESEGSMQWSDSGHLYLLIRRSALKKRDFSHVLAAACSG